MSARTKPKKRAPMKLRWYDALQECRDIPLRKPSGQAVIAVAGVLMSHADSDGGNCYPSTRTLETKARTSRRNVRLVLTWLVDNGWLQHKPKVNRRSTIFQLTIPVGNTCCPPDDPPWATPVTHQESMVGAVVGAVVGDTCSPYSVLRSETKEEEESATAPVTCVTVAALLHDCNSELVIDDNQHGGTRPSDQRLVQIARWVADHASVPIDLAVVGEAFRGALARLSWSPGVLAVYCVEKLKRNSRRVREPSAFLRTDLNRLAVDSFEWSPGMQYADLLDQLYELDSKLDDDDDECSPLEVFEDMLLDAKLLDPDGSDGCPDPFEAKEELLPQLVAHARRAIAQAEAHARTSQR